MNLTCQPPCEICRLKNEYIAVYSELHRKLALTAAADDLRQRLYRDQRLESLKALSAIDLLNRSGELETWKQLLTDLLSCREFHEGVIADTPTCPYCHLRPAQYREMVNTDLLLRSLDSRLGEMLKNWRLALRAALQSEAARRSLAAMSPVERKPVDDFLAQTDAEDIIADWFCSGRHPGPAWHPSGDDCGGWAAAGAQDGRTALHPRRATKPLQAVPRPADPRA